MTTPRFGPRGTAFWTSTTNQFDLTEAEHELLAEACRTLDNLDDLAATIATDGVTTTGSAGQTVVHPALTEARGQRVVLHRLLAALALPDDEGVPVQTARSSSARAAANARWNRNGIKAV